MAKTRVQNRTQITIEADFSKGMIRDVPRHAIPPGGVYDAVDFLLHKPGVAIKRGGTSYYSGTLAVGIHATSGLVDGADTPIVVGSDGHLYKAAVWTDLGGSTVATGSKGVVWYGGGKTLSVFPNGTGAPVKYDGAGAPAALGGTPPSASIAALFRQRLLLANTVANPSRLFFSPLPDIESTWDTANSWIDFDSSILALAALNEILLVFSKGGVYKVVGSTPPPNSDMTQTKILDAGVQSVDSVTVSGGNAIFANPSGVYMTNGSSVPESLTQQGGIETYWQQSLNNTEDPAIGVLKNQFLFVNVKSEVSLMCYLPRRSWWRVTNLGTTNLFFPSLTGEELYMTDSATNKVQKLSGIFVPASGNKNDANGTAVTPLLETRALGQGPTQKHFGNAHLTYDMRDAASDDPFMDITVAPGIEAPSFSTGGGAVALETTDAHRQRWPMAKVTQGLSVRFAQTGASSKTEIYSLEYEERLLTPVAGGP